MKCITMLVKKALSIQTTTTRHVAVVTKLVVTVPGIQIAPQFWVLSVGKMVRFN